MRPKARLVAQKILPERIGLFSFFAVFGESVTLHTMAHRASLSPSGGSQARLLGPPQKALGGNDALGGGDQLGFQTSQTSRRAATELS
jgi:hypothetical protein